MIASRRVDRENPLESTNAQLWLDKYLNREISNPEQEMVNQVTNSIKLTEEYKKFFDLWEKELEAYGAKTKQANTLGRLAIGMGMTSVIETNISLHHTYGTPLIPGTALKGLCAHYASKYIGGDWAKGGVLHKNMFGEQDDSGLVVFFDALLIPSTENSNPLKKDVITVHHPRYYQGENKVPADWDSTVIIPTITCTGSFLLALAGPDQWVDRAFDILKLALANEGIGARTSSGYGRMEFQSEMEVPQEGGYELMKARIRKEKPPLGFERGTVAKVFNEENGEVNPLKGGGRVRIRDYKSSGAPLHVGQILEYKSVKHGKQVIAQEIKILLNKPKE